MKQLDEALKSIDKAGFGYLKVELEATLNRRDSYDRDDCGDCDGDGQLNCEHCDGEGVLTSTVTTASGREIDTEEIECDECYGSGHQECYECDGSGSVHASSDFSEEEDCGEYILEQLSQEAKDALNYSEFYNDGSVDSEFTFTIPLKAAHLLPEYINAFSALAEANGQGMEIDGAGMHVAVIPHESEGRYPVRNFRLDSTKLANFTQEVTKLLPALFITACSGNFTRGLEYRMPKISNDKYSAIHIVDGSVLEYRLFETCYQRPEAIFEYIGTIARTLEYFANPDKKVKMSGKQYTFFDERGVKSLLTTPEQVRIIKSQLKFVKPKSMTIKELSDNREITLSVQEVAKAYSKKLSRARALYKEHIKAYQTAIEPALTDDEKERVAEYERYEYFRPTHDEEYKKAYVRNLRKPEQNEQKFIDNNIVGSRVAGMITV